ncbi:MAG: MaoC family dehydratase N-terminal domain-containing protein [Dehalococcoidia bacterium]
MTSAEPTTLVTPDMEANKGVWGPETKSYPVSESDIRKWAIAVYWPETPPRIYWDADYARTTSWGGIIAPEDFNPFAWPPERSAARQSAGPVPGKKPAKGENILNGGQTDTFFAPMRPGDIITSRSRLSHWEERQGRNGLTIFAYTETEWRNQKDELVKRRISIGVRY